MYSGNEWGGGVEDTLFLKKNIYIKRKGRGKGQEKKRALLSKL
jgi:hypothetical protein